jgi:hypothetical protein
VVKGRGKGHAVQIKGPGALVRVRLGPRGRRQRRRGKAAHHGVLLRALGRGRPGRRRAGGSHLLLKGAGSGFKGGDLGDGGIEDAEVAGAGSEHRGRRADVAQTLKPDGHLGPAAALDRVVRLGVPARSSTGVPVRMLDKKKEEVNKWKNPSSRGQHTYGGRGLADGALVVERGEAAPNAEPSLSLLPLASDQVRGRRR